MNAFNSLYLIASQNFASDINHFYCAPNPAGLWGTTFYFDTPPLNANLKIYSTSGRLVFSNVFFSQGYLPWDGKDMQGNTCPSGIYLAFADITNQDRTKERRITKVLIP